MAFLLTERYLLGFQASHVDKKLFTEKKWDCFLYAHLCKSKKKKRQSFQNISLVPLWKWVPYSSLTKLRHREWKPDGLRLIRFIHKSYERWVDTWIKLGFWQQRREIKAIDKVITNEHPFQLLRYIVRDLTNHCYCKSYSSSQKNKDINLGGLAPYYTWIIAFCF